MILISGLYLSNHLKSLNNTFLEITLDIHMQEN